MAPVLVVVVRVLRLADKLNFLLCPLALHDLDLRCPLVASFGFAM